MTRDPILHPVRIDALRPTQITVGFGEVAEKRRRWADYGEEKRREFLGQHMVPVLLGPKGRYYITDHHHLVRALHDEGCEEVAVTVIKDLGRLDRDAFWVYADNRGWCHPYDAAGARVTFDDIPKSVGGLADDPFRSLAGALRRAGGYAKEATPFSEFMWADFLRRRLRRREVESDFGHCVIAALALAKSDDAGYLPGWCGASTD